MANVTYTVVKGDTLSGIAVRYNTTVSNLVKLNDITNPDYIVVGQVLIISGTGVTTKKTTSSKATIKAFGLQSNTDRTMYATWTWTRSNTDNYQVRWYYATGDGIWFVGSDSTVEDRQCTYNAPSNATKVKFKVKPISKKKKQGGKEVSYWTASWSTERSYDFKNNPPTTPPVPTVTMKGLKLTAELNNLDVNATSIQFQIVKNDSSVFKTGKANIKTKHASYSCNVIAGSEYKVRCRAVRGNLYSQWSEYSDGVKTQPAASKGITTLKTLSETSVYIAWERVSNSESYTIEYTTKKSYFDSSSEVKSTSVNHPVAHAEITGLETGEEHFFRVRAVNAEGESAWTPIKSIKVGKAPSAPTTWSSTTTVIVGEDLKLYWVHNAEDGSSQTYAQLELIVDGVKTTKTIKNSTEEDKKDLTSVYSINTENYPEGTKIQWRVRTKGIIDKYGDWSVQRTIDVYAPPVATVAVVDKDHVWSDWERPLTQFPFYISVTAGPDTQKAIGWHVTIRSEESYETVDELGNVKMVKAGDAVYSKYFDIGGNILIELSAGDLQLESDVWYKVLVTAAMDSGLSAEAEGDLMVQWSEDIYEPNAEIGISEETLTASIRPYCIDEDENIIEGILLSVYRREYDGKFTEIATDIVNGSDTYITDPHPSLDYARYRIVAMSEETGAVTYYDVPGYPVNNPAIIIQWEEAWTNFDISNEDEPEQPPWAGSLLKLPYNVKVSNSNSPDVELVKYIGREQPVSYYGTQIGETATWNTEIPKTDKETLYALRRLSAWMGDVYVREPSGSGYWANVTVSYSQDYDGLVIPITLNVTRVSGGV